MLSAQNCSPDNFDRVSLSDTITGLSEVDCMRFSLAAVLVCVGTLLHAAEIRGKVTNAVGGEALGRINVSVLERKLETTTAADGTFLIRNLPPGNYTLRVNAV